MGDYDGDRIQDIAFLTSASPLGEAGGDGADLLIAHGDPRGPGARATRRALRVCRHDRHDARVGQDDGQHPRRRADAGRLRRASDELAHAADQLRRSVVDRAPRLQRQRGHGARASESLSIRGVRCRS